MTHYSSIFIKHTRYDQSNVTIEMTQPLWESMFGDVDDLDSASYPSVTLNFAHLSTIMPMLRAFGLYKDVGLKASDWSARERLWQTSKIGVFASNLAVLMFHCNQTSDKDSNQEETQDANSVEETNEEGDSSEEDSSEETSSEEESSQEESSEEAESSSDEDQTEEDVFSDSKARSGWHVMLLHQERPVPLEACDGVTFCPLQAFRQVVKKKNSNHIKIHSILQSQCRPLECLP